MNRSPHDDEGRLADLLRLLPEPPTAWVEAAKLLPAARAEIDQVVERARADAVFRRALERDLEAALAEAGYRPPAPALRVLRSRLARI